MNMTKTSTRLAALLFLGGISLACSSSGPVSIGNTQAIGAKLSDYAASWDGYAEAYAFMPSGSDRVRLTIDANGQGTLRFGDGVLFPPPSDPNVGYPPPNVVVDAGQNFDQYVVYTPSEGFIYPIYAAQVQTNRIQMGANINDLYDGWCAIQTPFLWYTVQTTQQEGGVADGGGDGGGLGVSLYACLPYFPISDCLVAGVSRCCLIEPNGINDPVDCQIISLCSPGGVCSCTAAGCTGHVVPAGTPLNDYPVELDAALDSTGTTLTGTLVLSGSRITVRLQKN